MKKLMRIIQLFGSGLLNGCIVFLVIFLMITNNLIPGVQVRSVLSESMEPNYSRGSAVFNKQITSQEKLRLGDVVTFEKHEEVVSHRIVALDRDTDAVITKGDNNQIADAEPVTRAEIEGRVFFQLPYVGYFIQTVETVNGKIAVIMLIVDILLIQAFFSILIFEKKKECKVDGEKN